MTAADPVEMRHVLVRQIAARDLQPQARVCEPRDRPAGPCPAQNRQIPRRPVFDLPDVGIVLILHAQHAAVARRESQDLDVIAQQRRRGGDLVVLALEVLALVNSSSVPSSAPSYYHQRQYFEGKDNKVSTASTLLRYDVEISGFPSSHCGHLVLLRVKDQDYPDVRQIPRRPVFDLPDVGIVLILHLVHQMPAAGSTGIPRSRRCCAMTSRSRDSRRATAGISCCCA